MTPGSCHHGSPLKVMKEKKPQFTLTRVNSDGSSEPAQVVPLAEAINARMSRRGFFGAGLSAAAALALLDSCATWNSVLSERPIDLHCGKRYAHSKDVVNLAISKYGSTLASVCEGHIVKCWRMSDYALIGAWTCKEIKDKNLSFDKSVSLAPDGGMIAFGTSTKEIELRSLPDGKLINSFQAESAAFDPNGGRLILIRPDALLIHNTSDRQTAAIPIKTNSAHGLAISPDGQQIAVSSRDGMLIFDSRGEYLKTLDSAGSSPAFSPDGQKLATVDSANIRLRRMPDGEAITAFKGQGSRAAFSSDGKLIFGQPNLKAWDVEPFKEKRIEPVSKECSIVFTPDGKYAITGGKNGSIKLWSMPNFDFLTCLMDVECSGQDVKGNIYTVTDEWGRTLSYTLPCGSPIPSGAKCTCDCVPGKVEKVCSCDRVCTCNRVCSCLSVHTSTRTYCSCDRVCSCLAVYR